MSSAASPWNAGEAREAAQRAASHAAVPSRRYAASSLTTPSHLRFEKVVRERGRRRAGGGGPGWRKRQKKCKGKQACGDVGGSGRINLQVAERAGSECVGGLE